MYQGFYGLRELPFELTPNPRFLFMTPGHREALSNLRFGLASGKAITLLLGEAGTGKTTLLRAALESDDCREIRVTYINNPALTRNEFVEVLAQRFGLSAAAAQSKATLLAEIEARLVDRRASGERTALVVDEAQRLSDELLEEIRLLANIETNEEKLLPLVLTGQPELGDRLNTGGLRQLKQRISLRCEVKPFDLAETAAYVAARIRVAGGDGGRLFTREAIALIHERSGGIARTINVICDNALLHGYAADVRPVHRQIVLDVCRDFDFDEPVPAGRLCRTGALEVSAPAPPQISLQPVLASANEQPVPSPAEPPPSRVSRELFPGLGWRRWRSLLGY